MGFQVDADFLLKIEDFVKNNLTGDWSRFDQEAPEPPHPIIKSFHAAGLSNWWLPSEFGGRNISLEDSVDIVAALAYGDAGIAFSLFLSIIGTSVLDVFGSPELKKKFFGNFARNGSYAALAGSEKEAGSELLNIKTQSALEGSNFVINGSKFISTNAKFADFIVTITADSTAPTGFRAILVPNGAEGLQVVKRWPMIGVRAAGSYQLEFKNCKIPKENGLEPNGLRILEIGLNPSRILIAACAIGIGRRMRDLCLEYAKNKMLRGKSMMENSVFAAKMGQMEMEIDCMRAVCKSAARDVDAIHKSPDRAAHYLRVGTGKIEPHLQNVLWTNRMAARQRWFRNVWWTRYTEEMLAGKLLRDMRYIAIVEGGEDVTRDLIFSRYVKYAT